MTLKNRSAKLYYTRNSTATGIRNVETTKRNEWHTILKKKQFKDMKMTHLKSFVSYVYHY